MKKLLAVLFFTLGLGLLYSSCCDSENPPFFDYSQLRVVPVTIVSQPSQSSYTAALSIIPDDISFISQTELPELIPSAYGLSCPEPGRDGPKHRLVSVTITADQDFDADHPAGSSLSALFINSFGPPKALTELDPAFAEFFSPEVALVVYCETLPADTSRVFQLTVRATKANGATAEGVIQGVKFQTR